MAADLWLTLQAVTLVLALVLAARVPLRRACGAGPAFGLWLLPLATLLLPWLPTMPTPWPHLPAVAAMASAALTTMPVAPHATGLPWWCGVWLAGAAAMMLRLLVLYLRVYRASAALPAALLASLRSEMDAAAAQRLRLHPAGPAVLWAPRSVILLPADFAQRFDPAQRRLVLRHELAHLRHGDALWMLLGEIAHALIWFHPLAWIARARFRLDMELACDERVLRAAPQEHARYARTLLHSAGIAPTSALIPWFTGAQLKERLTMIQHHRVGALRRCTGHVLLAALLVGSVFVAQATGQNQPAESNTDYNATIQPRYPVAAIKGAAQGTVILLVQVHPDGSVGTVNYDAEHSTTTSADLIAAATDAARQWHFQPELKDGKPVEGYARVPVKFGLTPLGDEKPASKS